MALLFCDSFDYYTLAQIFRKWSGTDGTGGPDQLSTSWGRNGTQGVRLMGVFANVRRMHKALPVNAPTLYVGMALARESASAQGLFSVQDNASRQVEVWVNADGSLTVYRGSQAAVLGTTAPGVLSGINIHDYIELGVTIHPSAGVVTLRVNMQTVLTLTAQNTRATANSYANMLAIGPRNENGITLWVDDVYVCDDSGSAPNNTFLGDVSIKALLPNGAGGSTQFTPSTGANYTCVDDATANDDTDYVASATVGHKDRYATANLASAGTVLAVAVNTVDRKEDAGTRTVAHVAELAGTELQGADFQPTVAYNNHQTVFPTKPGGGAWTTTDVNAMEIGLTITT